MRRWRRVSLIAIASVPLCQFFSGCFPNIPGLPNIPGAVNFELTNLINRVLLDSFSTIVLNVLNL
jgi:hypothetical protein